MADSVALSSFDALRSGLPRKIPKRFNIGVDVCDRWADSAPANPAIIAFENHTTQFTTFNTLKQLSNAMANLFVSHGLCIGDRVAVFLEQSIEVAISHIAAYKAAGIAVPLFFLFGDDAVQFRLCDSGASIVVTDSAKAARLLGMRDHLPQLKHIVVVDRAVEECISWAEEGARQSDVFSPVSTLAEDPALIIYTSGTTGQLNGALHAHRVLLGHLPGVEMSHNGFPHDGDLIWTPVDWACIGGLLDVLLPALHHGVPVVAHRFARFSAEAAFELITRLGIRNIFLHPTALRAMSTIENACDRWSLNVRSIASGGELQGTELQSSAVIPSVSMSMNFMGRPNTI